MSNYTLTRSRRKTVGLYIRNGALEVRAPLRMPKCDIDRFVASKEKWIADKLAESAGRLQERNAFALDYGSTILLRGIERSIEARDGTSAGFDGTVFYMPPNLPPEQIRDVCVQLYRRLAKLYLPERTAYFAERMNASPASVKISSAKTRWGSCSGRKNINYSWRLLMAEDDVIDYVIVHELAHLTEMNHSPRFWAVVEGILPNYRERKSRLKVLHDRLSGEKWEE